MSFLLLLPYQIAFQFSCSPRKKISFPPSLWACHRWDVYVFSIEDWVIDPSHVFQANIQQMRRAPLTSCPQVPLPCGGLHGRVNFNVTVRCHGLFDLRNYTDRSPLRYPKLYESVIRVYRKERHEKNSLLDPSPAPRVNRLVLRR